MCDSPTLTRTSTATTRSVAALAPSGNLLLARGQVLTSPETGARYHVEHLLGEGGFGQAYLARRSGASGRSEAVCVKASRRIDGWVREAYFGQLLAGHARAIRVFDAFPLPLADG